MSDTWVDKSLGAGVTIGDRTANPVFQSLQSQRRLRGETESLNCEVQKKGLLSSRVRNEQMYNSTCTSCFIYYWLLNNNEKFIVFF